MKKPKIGLALGGGGARGMAHVGVLKVLERNAVPIDLIAGTSIGALVGGAYAQHPDTSRLEARVLDFLDSPAFKESGLDRFSRNEAAENFFGQVAKYVRERVVINLAHSREALARTSRLAKVVDAILEDTGIEESHIPLVIVATDLVSGEDVMYQQGGIREACLASASIPGFLPPIEHNGSKLVDGAVTAPVPVQAARALGADIVIAVDVSQDLDPAPEIQSIVDIMFRASSVTNNKLKSLMLRNADVVIRPAVGHEHWADFGNTRELIREGEKAARDNLNEIECALREFDPTWKKLFGIRKKKWFRF